MVRKASGPKGRGIRWGLQRYKVRVNKSQGEDPAEAPAAGIITEAAKSFKEYVTRVCILFCLIPIVRSPSSSIRGHKYQLAPLWKRIVHYVLMSFFVAFTVYKTAVTVLPSVQHTVGRGCFHVPLLTNGSALITRHCSYDYKFAPAGDLALAGQL